MANCRNKTELSTVVSIEYQLNINCRVFAKQLNFLFFLDIKGGGKKIKSFEIICLN